MPAPTAARKAIHETRFGLTRSIRDATGTRNQSAAFRYRSRTTDPNRGIVLQRHRVSSRRTTQKISIGHAGMDGRDIPSGGIPWVVVVVAKVGVLEKKGKVRTAEGTYEVSLSDDDWYAVRGPASEAAGRVRYDDEGNLLEIEKPGVRL